MTEPPDKRKPNRKSAEGRRPASGRNGGKKKAKKRKKPVKPEDLSEVLKSAETEQSSSSAQQEVSEVVDKVHEEIEEKNAENGASSADYSAGKDLKEYSSEVEVEGPYVQPSIDPEEAAAADDFTLYKFRKTTDPQQRLHGGDYDKPWGNFFLSYVKDSVNTRLKQANALAKKSLNSAMQGANVIYDTLYGWTHHKKK